MAGIASDRLYPLAQQEELVRHLPGGAPLRIIESESGHDGFLLELGQVGAIVSATLGYRSPRALSTERSGGPGPRGDHGVEVFELLLRHEEPPRRGGAAQLDQEWAEVDLGARACTGAAPVMTGIDTVPARASLP